MLLIYDVFSYFPSKKPSFDTLNQNNNKNSDVNQQPMHDMLAHADATLQRDNYLLGGKVKVRSLSPDGIIIGHCNGNPVLDTLACDVEFSERSHCKYDS